MSTSWTKFIKLPLSENEFKQPDILLSKVHGFPQCLGAVDGTKNNSTDFINRKGHHSINIHPCVNYNHYFVGVLVKWLGRVHDARICGNSSINQMLKDGTIPICFKAIVDGADPVPLCIYGILHTYYLVV